MKQLRISALAVILVAGVAGGVIVANKATSSQSLATSQTLAAKVAYSKNLATLTWASQAGASGYSLLKNDVQVSTAGPGATSARFSVSGNSWSVAAVANFTPPVTTTTTTTSVPPTTTVSTTTSSTTTTGPPPAAQVSVAVSGSDSTCARNGVACSSFDRAYQIANSGDTISVSAGNYPRNGSAVNSATTAINPSGSKVVTFVCQGNGDVTQQAPVFSFTPDTNGPQFVGDCFHFHIVTFGYGGYTGITQNIVLDGVHMQGLECAGCRNVTLRNGEVGPFLYCYKPGDVFQGTTVPSYAFCDPNGPTADERYWAAQPQSMQNFQQEPFIHNGGAGFATNVTLDHEHIHGIVSKWAGTHTGGLLLWNTTNLHITYTTFDHNGIYDTEENADSTDSGLLFDHDTFGVPICSYDAADCAQYGGAGAPLPNSFRESTFGVRTVLNNATVSNSTFTNGILFYQGTYNNFLVTGNKLGSATNCPWPGVTFTGNDKC